MRSEGRSTTVMVVCAGLVLGGCASNKLKASQPLTVMQLCALYQSAMVHEQSSAYGAGPLCVQYLHVSGTDLTGSALATACRPGQPGRAWAESLLAAVDAGRVHIDWSQAQDCLEQTRQLRSSNPPRTMYTTHKTAWDALQNGVCKTFVSGTRSIGDSCVDDWDCPDGAGCFTDKPFTPGSQRCMAPATKGQSCFEEPYSQTYWLPCADGLTCNLTTSTQGTCAPGAATGASCSADTDCASGRCAAADPTNPNNTTCLPVPTKKIGESCSSSAECLGDCVSCRPTAPVAQPTCQVLGGEGDYCRDWNDCVWDLGCTNGKCTTVGAGTTCGGNTYNLCSVGLACVPSTDCSSITDATACAAPDCYYDSTQGCVAVGGTCSALPSNGPCLNGFACDASSTCMNGQCVALGGQGDACSDSGPSAPPCQSGLQCVNGSCKSVCATNADCADGEYCDTNALVPECKHMQPTACTDSVQCPAGQYCYNNCATYSDKASCQGDSNCMWNGTCDPTTDCTTNTTQGTCTGDCTWLPDCELVSDCSSGTATTCGGIAGCAWDTTSSSCVDACNLHSNDQSACDGATGCTFDPFSGECSSSCAELATSGDCTAQAAAGCGWSGVCSHTVDCSTHDGDPSGCGSETSCSYTYTGPCQAGATPAFNCVPQLDVGQKCGDNPDCKTGACAMNDNGDFVCAYVPSGCDTTNDTVFARLAFLFGGVWIVGRKRRRHRRNA